MLSLSADGRKVAGTDSHVAFPTQKDNCPRMDAALTQSLWVVNVCLAVLVSELAKWLSGFTAVPDPHIAVMHKTRRGQTQLDEPETW